MIAWYPILVGGPKDGEPVPDLPPFVRNGGFA